MGRPVDIPNSTYSTSLSKFTLTPIFLIPPSTEIRVKKLGAIIDSLTNPHQPHNLQSPSPTDFTNQIWIHFFTILIATVLVQIFIIFHLNYWNVLCLFTFFVPLESLSNLFRPSADWVLCTNDHTVLVLRNHLLALDPNSWMWPISSSIIWSLPLSSAPFSALYAFTWHFTELLHSLSYYRSHATSCLSALIHAFLSA